MATIFPNKAHIYPDSGNFWSFRQVFDSFTGEDHNVDHLKGSLVLDLIPLCAIMILIWLGVCLERVIVRKTRGTDEPPWPAENDNRFHVGRHMLDGVYSKDDRRYIETKLLDHDRPA